MYSEIIHTVHTKKDLDVILRELEKLQKSVYETDTTVFDEALSKYVRSDVAKMIRADLNTQQVAKDEYFKVLDRRLRVLKPLKLTMAFEPSENFEERVHEWATKNIGEFVYIHFVYNPTVVGGALIEYEGKFHDFSLNKTLDELFTQESENIVTRLTQTS